MNILNEANSDLHEDVTEELKILHMDIMHINDLFQIDFGDKPEEWIYSIGLDNDHADAIFAMKLQRAFIEFENLDISLRLQLGESTKYWIGSGLKTVFFGLPKITTKKAKKIIWSFLFLSHI